MPRLPSKAITQTLVNSAKPQAKRYEIRDSQLSGFMLRVSPSSQKTYYVQLERGMKRSIGDASIMTLSRARRLALEMLQRHEAGERIESRRDKRLTLGEFARGEYASWTQLHLKTGTANADRILRACKTLLGTKLDKLSEVQIERWKMNRLKSGLSPSTVKRDLAELKSALNKAIKFGHLRENPAWKVKVKVTTDHRVRYLNDFERQALLEALRERDRKKKRGRISGNIFRLERGYEVMPPLGEYSDYLTPLVMLVLNTGLRRSEALSLTWENTNLDMNPRVTVLAAHAKSGVTRHVPLNTTAVKLLKLWASQNSHSGLVFPNPVGGQIGSIKTAWGKLIREAGISNFRFHDLRHDFASRLVMSGVDLYRVKELLGHGSIDVTQRYAHLSPETLAEAVEEIA